MAGTTGSGKSEVIQSIIAALAATYHPHEMAFMLIDYKGGGMSNTFAITAYYCIYYELRGPELN